MKQHILILLCILAIELNAEQSIQKVQIEQQNPKEPPIEVQIRNAVNKVDLAYLLNLDDVIDSSEFRFASPKKREEWLITEFLRRKKNTYKDKATTICAWKIAGLALGAGIISVLHNWTDIRKKISPKVDHSTLTVEQRIATRFEFYFVWVWVTLGLSQDSGSDISLINLIKKAYEASSIASGVSEIDDPYTELELMFVKKYHLIKQNPALFKAIKTKLIELRSDLITAFKYYEDFVQTATGLPHQRGQFIFNEEVFNDFFQFYPDPIRQKLRNLAARLSYFSQSETDAQMVNFPIYFIGVPGTGKTYAANGLAAVTNAPIIKLTLDGGTIEDVIGTKSTQNKLGKPGKLLEAYRAIGLLDPDKQFNNGILFIDEFDRLLNAEDPASRALLSFMLKLLDPKERKFYSPFLEAEIKLPSMIILAGNHAIKDTALANRFQQLSFNGYNLTTKERVTEARILPNIAKIFDYKISDLNSEDYRHIHDIILNDNGDVGLRYIELGLIQFFEQKRIDSIYGMMKPIIPKKSTPSKFPSRKIVATM